MYPLHATQLNQKSESSKLGHGRRCHNVNGTDYHLLENHASITEGLIQTGRTRKTAQTAETKLSEEKKRKLAS